MKSLNWHFLILASFLIFCGSFLTSPEEVSAFAGGDGSPGDPYQVASWADLNDVRNYLSSSFILNNDLSSTTTGYTGLGDSWTPIGTGGSQFTGTFNGNNHSISNLIVSLGASGAGLFGATLSTTISNLALLNVSVSGTSNIGGLIGYHISGTISNCSVSGTVTGSSNSTGGLVGYFIEGDIISSHTAVQVTGTREVGGLVGYHVGSGVDDDISSSYATGNVIGTGQNIGGLVGYVADTAYISGSYAEGNISGGTVAHGGLVGYQNRGSVTDSHAIGTVSGTSMIGGLLGQVGDQVDISNSYATGDITGTSDYCGGLVGYHADGAISNCYATGDVNSPSGDGNGGFAGYVVAGNFSLNYSTGDVTGNDWVGGFAGDKDGGDTTNCYSTGDVTGSGDMVGGFMGWYYDGTMSKVFSTGLVTGGTNVGGLVGLKESGLTVVDSFWDIDTSGQSGSAGGTGTTTSAMKLLTTFGAWDIGTTTSDFNTGYPFLSWQEGASSFDWLIPYCPGGMAGLGTVADPCQVEDWSDLDSIRNNLAKNYILNDDLSSTTTGYAGLGDDWVPLGTHVSPFEGSFSGNDKTISDIIINLPLVEEVGLFGSITGSVLDLGVLNVNISGYSNVGGLAGELIGFGTSTDSYTTGVVTGADSDVGGLIGYTAGTVLNCYSSVTVNSSYDVAGGLIGHQGGEIYNSYATGDVIATGDYIGGLVGDSTSLITDSYAIGDVSGNDSVGGLVGTLHTSGTTTNSFSTGNITGSSNVGGLIGYNYGGGVINSFWDTQTSGQASSAGGTGTTTSAMKLLTTFGAWDIGTTTSDFNTGYPFLSWQEGASSFDWLIKEEISNTIPNVPVLVSPADASTVDDSTPTLSANYHDSDVGDVGVTNYRIATSSSNCLTGLTVATGTSAVTSDEDENTSWTPDSAITDGTYYWCTQNNDGTASSAWTAMGSFIIDTVVSGGGGGSTVIIKPIDSCDPHGDINKDGKINLTDFSILMYFWGQTKPSNPCADINSDGIVNLRDFSIMLFWWTR